MMETPKYPLPIVGALVVNPENKILLVTFDKKKKIYGLPGGKIEWGEKIEDAVKREVKEEVGLDVELVYIPLVQEAIFPKEIPKREDKHMIFLECVCRTKSSDVRMDGKEIDSYIWIDPKKALNLNVNSYTKIFIRKYLETK
jgi:nucleoside triphosphatase